MVLPRKVEFIMSRQGWTLFTVVAAVLVGAGFSMKPWKALKTQWKESESAVKETRVLEQQRSDLIRENARLDSPFGMEEQAREMGYRKPYERPLVVITEVDEKQGD